MWRGRQLGRLRRRGSSLRRDLQHPEDDDCDGQQNEDGDGCVCVPAAAEACYGGPDGTEGVGACKAGTRTCDDVGVAWGSCEGEVVPATEDCYSAGDEDCDGVPCSETIYATLFGDVDSEGVSDAVFDSAGNLLVVGVFTGSLTIGDTTLVSVGSGDVFVTKIDDQGQPSWSKSFGGVPTMSNLDLADAYEETVVPRGRVLARWWAVRYIGLPCALV